MPHAVTLRGSWFVLMQSAGRTLVKLIVSAGLSSQLLSTPYSIRHEELFKIVNFFIGFSIKG